MYKNKSLILLFVLSLISCSSMSFTVTCLTKDGYKKHFNYKSVYPRVKKSYLKRTARYAVKSCYRKSRWPRSCRLVRCKAAIIKWRCQSFFVFRGRYKYFYQTGVSKRNARYRAIQACSRHYFRRKYALSCHYGRCKRIKKQLLWWQFVSVKVVIQLIIMPFLFVITYSRAWLIL